MCYSLFVTMPRIYTLRVELTSLSGGEPEVCERIKEEEVGEASVEEHSRDLAQSLSSNERVVESRRGGCETILDWVLFKKKNKKKKTTKLQLQCFLFRTVQERHL